MCVRSMAEIRRKFMEYDQDGNGVVTMQEAHDILQKELSFSPQQSIELVRRYDKNGDGQLSYEEFAKFYDKVKSKSVATPSDVNARIVLLALQGFSDDDI